MTTRQDVLQEALHEFDRVAWSIADAGFEEASWLPLRKYVIDLIERGNAAVALVDGAPSDSWTAIRWDETDAPVMLARAFGKAHRRLAAALDKTAQPSPRRVLEPAVVGGEHQPVRNDSEGIASGIATAGTQLPTPVPA